MRPRLLLVDDDETRAALVARTLSRDYECSVVHTADGALRALAERGWAAALVDWDLGRDGSGLMVLQAVRMLDERAARLLYSSYLKDALVQDAERLAGAQAVIHAKQAEFLLDLRRALERLLAAGGGPGRTTQLPVAAGEEPWCARAPVTVRFLEELRRAAGESVPVFVHGEEGSGKRLAAATLLKWREELGVKKPPDDWSKQGRPPCVIRVPPLRERREDLAGLCETWLARFAEMKGQAPKRLAAETLTALRERPWWKNVGELHSVLSRAERNAGGRREVTVADLPSDSEPAEPPMELAKRDGLIQAILLQLRTTGSINAAAKLANETRPNYKRRMAKVGILRADSR